MIAVILEICGTPSSDRSESDIQYLYDWLISLNIPFFTTHSPTDAHTPDFLYTLCKSIRYAELEAGQGN